MGWTECVHYGAELLLAVIVALAVFLVVLGPMRRLLGANARLKQARPFFTRALFVVLLLGALAPVIGDRPAEADSCMEYVWQAADALESVLLSVVLFLFGFVLVMTVLAAALGRYRDE